MRGARPDASDERSVAAAIGGRGRDTGTRNGRTAGACAASRRPTVRPSTTPERDAVKDARDANAGRARTTERETERDGERDGERRRETGEMETIAGWDVGLVRGADGDFGGNSRRDRGARTMERAVEPNRSSLVKGLGASERERGVQSSPTNVLDARSCASSDTSEEPDRDAEDLGEIGKKTSAAVDADVVADRGGWGADVGRDERGRERMLGAMTPSAEDESLHKRLSELRTALRTAEQVLDRTQNRLQLAEGARQMAEAEAATLRARVWSMEGGEALVLEAGRDGCLDELRGQLLKEATVELSYAAKVTTASDHKVQALREDCKKLQDTIAALSAASTAENATLSMELAQARMRIRCDAREIATLVNRVNEAEAQSTKLKGSNEIANTAIERCQAVENECQRAKESLHETMRHNEFLHGRVNELEEMIKCNGQAHYDQELRQVRENLESEVARLRADVKQERAARKALETRSNLAIPTDTKCLPNTQGDALESERSKNEALMEEITHLKSQLMRVEADSPRKDDWSDALGFTSNDDNESVDSQPGTPRGVRDALLAAARLEVQKLGEMNRKLMQAKLLAENDSVSKVDYEAALTRNNEAWASKVAGVELSATKMREELTALTRRNEKLDSEIQTNRIELDEMRIQNRKLEASLSTKDVKQEATHDEGSWLKLLPRRHSSPGIATQQDNNLTRLGSWASLGGMEDEEDDMCRLEDNGEETDTKLDEPKQRSRKQVLEERSRSIRERLAARKGKPPLGPLKLSEEAMERSIRESRLAIEAMKASRSSLLRVSTGSPQSD